MLIAPMIAPIIGTILLQWHWRSIFVFLAIYAVIAMFAYSKFVGETKTEKRALSFGFIFSQYKRVLTLRENQKLIGIRYFVLAGLTSGIFLTFLTHSTWVYLSYYNVSQALLPLLFAIHAFSLIIANVILSRLLPVIDASRLLGITTLLQLGLIALLAIVYTTMKPALVVYLILTASIMCAGAMTIGCTMGMLFAYYNALSGSAVALLSLTRGVFAALLGGISTLLLNQTLDPILITVFVASVLCCLVRTTLSKTRLDELSKRDH
jgi:DHA1 family bicyclomycin/chloramphenicol resistance-like MFS transporter